MTELECPFCSTSLDEHEASQCLDAWCHNLLYPDNKAHEFQGRYIIQGGDDTASFACVLKPRHYSCSISAAWELVKHIREQIFSKRNRFYTYFAEQARATTHGGANPEPFWWFFFMSNAPLAITKAAIAAMENNDDC